MMIFSTSLVHFLSHFHIAVDQRARRVFFLPRETFFSAFKERLICLSDEFYIYLFLYSTTLIFVLFFSCFSDDADSNDSCCPRGKSQSPEPCHLDERNTNLHLVSVDLFFGDLSLFNAYNLFLISLFSVNF